MSGGSTTVENSVSPTLAGGACAAPTVVPAAGSVLYLGWEAGREDRPYASFYLSFTSTERDVPAISDWLLRSLQPQLATLPGVQRVTIEGGRQLAAGAQFLDGFAQGGVGPSDTIALN